MIWPPVSSCAMPRPATMRMSVATMGCMPALTTSSPFHSPQAAATASAVREREPQRIAAGDRARRAETAADHQRGDRRGNGHDGADRDVEAAHRDHQRHAERHHHERRGAIQDVDEAAVEVAVAPREREERRIEQAARDQQQRQRDRRPEQRVLREALHALVAAQSANTPRLRRRRAAIRRPWRGRAAP